MMQAHSYTGRVAHDFLPIPCLPRKPETRPCGVYRETEKPAPPSSEEQYSQQGPAPVSLDRTH